MDLTQQDAAVLLGVAIRTFQLWEGAHQLPDGEHAYTVEVRLGVPLVASRKRPTPEETPQPGWGSPLPTHGLAAVGG